MAKQVKPTTARINPIVVEIGTLLRLNQPTATTPAMQVGARTTPIHMLITLNLG